MKSYLIGEPVYFKGKYKQDKVYDLYIQEIVTCFELKENKIPTIQIKNNKFRFKETEYLTSSKGELVTLTLTSIDLELFLEQYNILEIHYISGWKFKSINGIFDTYIDKWIERKIQASKEGNKRSKNPCKINVKCFVW